MTALPSWRMCSTCARARQPPSSGMAHLVAAMAHGHTAVMNILIIGGNRFMGLGLVWRLLFAGHRVALLNRGRGADPFGTRVERIVADRGSDAFDHALTGRSFDRVIDFAGFSGADLARTVRVLSGRVGHYVFISTGQVYLVREDCAVPARESDYDGPVMARPPTPADYEDWAYGIGKRDAEQELMAAAELPSTRLRIPMVNGEGDPNRRIEAYLWRLLDRGPLLVARASALARHVYRGAVVAAVAAILEQPPVPGQVFNLAQNEVVTVRELIDRLAARVGARAEIIEVESEQLEDVGLSARAASPFSSRWMSQIDPARAVAELGFVHPSLDQYLEAIVTHLLAAWPGSAPEGYAQRERELAWCRRSGQ
jgi:nucleoside-diphosphate-sugar epimerase